MADHCSCCNGTHSTPVTEHRQSSPVQCVIVWSPDLVGCVAVNLTPANGYTICRDCQENETFSFVRKCIASVAQPSHLDRWSMAIIVLEDGEGFKIKAKRSPLASA